MPAMRPALKRRSDQRIASLNLQPSRASALLQGVRCLSPDITPMTHVNASKPPRKKPKPTQPAKPAEPREKASLHPRNRHQGHYDFAKLIKGSPELGKFVIINPYGKESIDYANPAAVRVFNRALLKSFYGIAHWDIPADYL